MYGLLWCFSLCLFVSFIRELVDCRILGLVNNLFVDVGHFQVLLTTRYVLSNDFSNEWAYYLYCGVFNHCDDVLS